MNIAIYQINPDRDENNVAFLNYENMERFQGSAALRSEIYDKVFEGEVATASATAAPPSCTTSSRSPSRKAGVNACVGARASCRCSAITDRR